MLPRCGMFVVLPQGGVFVVGPQCTMFCMMFCMEVSWTRGGRKGGRGEDMKLAVFKIHRYVSILGGLAKDMPSQALPSFSTTQNST